VASGRGPSFLFASLGTVATDRTLCVHKLELREYCSMEQFSWKATRSVYRQTDRQTDRWSFGLAVHRSNTHTDRQQVVVRNSQVSDWYNINVSIGRYIGYRYIMTRSENSFLLRKQI